MERPFGFTRRVDTTLSYDDAITVIKAALQEQGFGTLTEIDVRATLKPKLDVDTAPELIIGRALSPDACSPDLVCHILNPAAT